MGVRGKTSVCCLCSYEHKFSDLYCEQIFSAYKSESACSLFHWKFLLSKVISLFFFLFVIVACLQSTGAATRDKNQGHFSWKATYQVKLLINVHILVWAHLIFLSKYCSKHTINICRDVCKISKLGSDSIKLVQFWVFTLSNTCWLSHLKHNLDVVYLKVITNDRHAGLDVAHEYKLRKTLKLQVPKDWFLLHHCRNV